MNELGITEIVISFAAVLLAVVVFFARKLMNAFADDFSAKALERVNNELRADIVDVLGGMMVELGDSNSAVMPNLVASSSCHCSTRPPGAMMSIRVRSPRSINSLAYKPAMIVLPAPGSSASRNLSGVRGRSSP